MNIHQDEIRTEGDELILEGRRIGADANLVTAALKNATHVAGVIGIVFYIQDARHGMPQRFDHLFGATHQCRALQRQIEMGVSATTNRFHFIVEGADASDE
jgi:hypothetical protein